MEAAAPASGAGSAGAPSVNLLSKKLRLLLSQSREVFKSSSSVLAAAEAAVPPGLHDHDAGSARCSMVPSHWRAPQQLAFIPPEGHAGTTPGSCAPLAQWLSSPPLTQHWMRLAKLTINTLHDRGKGLHDRLETIKNWERSHPLPDAAAMALMQQAAVAAVQSQAHVPADMQLPQQATTLDATDFAPTATPMATGAAAAPPSMAVPPKPTKPVNLRTLLVPGSRGLPGVIRTVDDQIQLVTPFLDGRGLGEGEHVPDVCVRGLWLVLARALQNRPPPTPPCLEFNDVDVTCTRALLGLVADAWVSVNCDARDAVRHGDAMASALLLYNQFAHMLPSSIWTTVWLYVTLLLQPVKVQDAADKVGQAMYSLHNTIGSPDNLAAAHALKAALDACPPGQLAAKVCASLPVLAAAPTVPESIIVSHLAAFNFGALAWPIAPQTVPPLDLTTLPADRINLTMPAAAALSWPPSRGPCMACLTVWDILRNPALTPAHRSELTAHMAQVYSTGSQQAFLPVAQRVFVFDGGSPSRPENCPCAAVWLCPVDLPALATAAAHGGSNSGSLPSPVQSQYAPRIRIKGLGRALTAQWAIRAHLATENQTMQ